MENIINNIYEKLLARYGQQGWWPLINQGGYHYGEYDLVKLEDQRFEICLGAILTQNTTWLQVEKVIAQLNKEGFLNSSTIKNITDEKLQQLIRPAGYFIQKTKKIKLFTDFFIELNGRVPSREDLLAIWGIGSETADSILLYAYNEPYFVVDAYTVRLLNHLQIIPDKLKYNEIQKLFHDALRNDYKIFQEYHALIVQHGKNFYSKKPYGQGEDKFFYPLLN